MTNHLFLTLWDYDTSIPLNDFKMTPERVNDIMMGVKAKLIDLTQRYKMLGNGDSQLAKKKTITLMINVMSLKVLI